MSTIEDTKFTDADYIREIAKRYDHPQIADFRAHHARLLRIADRLSAGGGEAVAWQCKFIGNPHQEPYWTDCSRETYEARKGAWDYEVRALGVIGGAGGVPAGWKLVPVEPTEGMHAAGVRTIVRCSGNDDWPPRVWQAMLNAAPPLPGVVAGGEPK